MGAKGTLGKQGGAWLDFSNECNPVGWSVFTRKSVFYKKIDNKTVMVAFDIIGTSNTTTVSFKIPHAPKNRLLAYYFPAVAQNNGGASSTPARVQVSRNTIPDVVDVRLDYSGTVWTASGTKLIEGFLIYEIED